MRTTPTRVLVVDDSAFFRKQITACLEADPGYRVVGCAGDGRSAVALAARLAPDVVTMDVAMPVMDGIDAVRRIMQARPVPILMISALTRAGAEATLAALDAGAGDFITKPTLASAAERGRFGARLRQRLGALRDAPVDAARRVAPLARGLTRGSAEVDCVVIGASTGGPPLVGRILAALPAAFARPVVVAQHMPGSFTGYFAERLDGQCDIRVRLASDGIRLEPGTAYIAPGGCQTTFVGRGEKRLRVVGDEVERYRPCIDRTFASAAEVFGRRVLAIVLTGMGDDGRAGGGCLKAAGAPVWAQDESSSAVFGMPRAVIEAGLADAVLPGDAIAPRLLAAP
ncbi:MAG: chemotaxis response regulator protein-glutamate methylesterase [Gammaproteobacteria bacterium]|nr:chemotaxis response regulator protein-glutamate methylesterase [Gammaproteobacteria bacterium]MCP5202271.1 chemotaxis response regulator protein-glutamate methylesterase [Gammaproteobacteria bacterium]